MSSILIKNIEMPKERESFTVTIKYNGLVLDTETGIQVAEAYELPPHGRLIEAAYAEEHIRACMGNGRPMYSYDSNEICEMLNDCPTIIEAELPVHHGAFAATSEQEALERIILPEGEE